MTKNEQHFWIYGLDAIATSLERKKLYLRNRRGRVSPKTHFLFRTETSVILTERFREMSFKIKFVIDIINQIFIKINLKADKSRFVCEIIFIYAQYIFKEFLFKKICITFA